MTSTRTLDQPDARTAPTATRLVPIGVASVGTAAIAAVLVAAGARGLDVPLAVDDGGGPEQIPIAAFAIATLIAGTGGLGLAALVRRFASQPSRTFVVIAVVLTVLSIGPVLAVDADTATQVVLAISHLVVAAIVVPPLARALRR